MPLPSKRDPEELRRRIERWLAARLPEGAAPRIPAVSVPEGNGLSSETLLFEARWREGGEARGGQYVARLAPDMQDFPVFPSYDLSLQHRCMQQVAAHSDVPVPRAPWLEPDPRPLGSPFLVMERIEGRVPPDLPPYVFAGWLFDASPAERAALQRESLGVLARLHAIDPARAGLGFLGPLEPAARALARQLEAQRTYYEWAREGVSYPIIERTFAWLDAHLPAPEGGAVLNWGDARIGNLLFQGFRVAGVLDWEMATLGPPEVDVAWMVFMHRFFADLAEGAGQPGLPGFLAADDAIATYQELSGRTLRDFAFYEVLAALRFAVISIRTTGRSVAYGAFPKPETPEGLIMHRHAMQRMLDGGYWS